MKIKLLTAVVNAVKLSLLRAELLKSDFKALLDGIKPSKFLFGALMDGQLGVLFISACLLENEGGDLYIPGIYQ